MKSPLLALTALAPLPLAQGSVHIVDDDGGPGVFTTIEAAVDAAGEGDLILVRDGTYPGFSFESKSVSIAADAGAAPRVGASSIGFLSTEQSVVVRGIDFESTGPEPGFLYDFSSSELWLEDAELIGSRGFESVGGGLASQVLTRCSTAPTFAAGIHASGSKMHIFDTAAFGTDGTPAGHGLLIHSGQVYAHALRARGGSGTPGACDPCTDGGPGGDGVRVQEPGRLVVRAGAFEGGAGGATCCPEASSGAAGDDVKLIGGEFGGELHELSGSARTFAATSPVPAGGSTTLTMEVEPTDFVAVLYSTEQNHTYVTATGSLVVGLDFGIVALGTTPSGTIVETVGLPTPAPGTFFELFLQLAVLTDEGRIVLASPSVVHALGALP